MKFLTAQFYESELFYQNYYLPNITFEEYMKQEMAENDSVHCFDEARAVLEKTYESNIKRYFQPSIFYYNELKKYLYDEKSKIIPLNEYIFFKIRMYAIKFLAKSDEADEAYEEEKNKSIKEKYPVAVVELARCAFHDYRVVFEEKENTILANYYLGDENPCYVFSFQDAINTNNVLFQKEYRIIYEEVFLEHEKISYNILARTNEEDAEYVEMALISRNVSIFYSCNDIE
ncbi:hypothetical protein [Anaerosporobacter faecicola]|uniref:hypothetical protein n=1 Tax=Anaerosporobacter faecicola TaxID=2718714 RepID=UPI0014392789|nr:hypothetical protein [Anaerosporobacter faecicola]